MSLIESELFLMFLSQEGAEMWLLGQYEILKYLFQTKSGISLYPKPQLLTLLLPAAFFGSY